MHTQDLGPGAHSRSDPAALASLWEGGDTQRWPDMLCLRPLLGVQAGGPRSWLRTPRSPLSDSLKPLLFFFFFLEVKEKEKKGNYLQHPPPGEGGAGGSRYSRRWGGLQSRCNWSLLRPEPEGLSRLSLGLSSSALPLLCSLTCPFVPGGLGRSWDASPPWRSRGSSLTAVDTKAGA